jgi:ABC-type Fe3+ transport system permease subunit
MLVLALLGMFGREGIEDEVRFIQRPQFKWIYRIGGIVMLLVTMNLAGVI